MLASTGKSMGGDFTTPSPRRRERPLGQGWSSGQVVATRFTAGVSEAGCLAQRLPMQPADRITELLPHRCQAN